MNKLNLQFPAWPVIAQDEIDAVSDVLKSGKINYWTGDLGKAFEQQFAHYIGCEYGVAVANGTVGLELALKAINLQAGDEVIVPSKTFIATASAVVACNGKPVVADVELDTQNISAETILPNISDRTKAIILVHVAGLPCDMDPILALAKKHNLFVIEDCAQAHGAQYKGKYAGSFGDVAVFSFCQDKIMTTGGEGGMLVTNNTQIWQRAWEYKDHGKDYAAVHDTISQASPGFKWLHNSFGSNYRLTEMQAAIGLLQLKKLPAWVATRRRNALHLLQGMKNIKGLIAHTPSGDYTHAYYKFYFHINESALKAGNTRDTILAAINELGVPCREGVCSEIYREQAFIKAGFGPTNICANAQILTRTSMMLPVHPTLEIQHMQSMLDVISNVMENAVK